MTNPPISLIVISLRLHLKKGRAWGGKCGHKSGSVSLPGDFSSCEKQREITHHPLREAGRQKTGRVMCE